MAKHDLHALTRKEQMTLTAIEFMRAGEDKSVSPKSVAATISSMGGELPKNGVTLTLNRMKSIIIKMGDRSPISADYSRGRGHSAVFKLKQKGS